MINFLFDPVPFRWRLELDLFCVDDSSKLTVLCAHFLLCELFHKNADHVNVFLGRFYNSFLKDQFSCTQGTIDSVCSVKWNRVRLSFGSMTIGV